MATIDSKIYLGALADKHFPFILWNNGEAQFNSWVDYNELIKNNTNIASFNLDDSSRESVSAMYGSVFDSKTFMCQNDVWMKRCISKPTPSEDVEMGSHITVTACIQYCKSNGNEVIK